MFVTSRLNRRVEKLIRDACASTVGGARFCAAASTSAPIACFDSLRPSMPARTVRRRAAGSSIPTGSSPCIAAMRLPIRPCSALVRIETGTSARSWSPSVAMPRERSQRPRAPATTASTTSLTVPPNAFLTCLSSARSQRTSARRRCGPIGTLSGVAGAGFSATTATSPSPSRTVRAASTASPGWVAAAAARPASASGARMSPRTPRATSPARVGARRGAHARSECGTGLGSGSRSKSTVARSTPPTPSTSA